MYIYIHTYTHSCSCLASLILERTAVCLNFGIVPCVSQPFLSYSVLLVFCCLGGAVYWAVDLFLIRVDLSGALACCLALTTSRPLCANARAFWPTLCSVALPWHSGLYCSIPRRSRQGCSPYQGAGVLVWHRASVLKGVRVYWECWSWVTRNAKTRGRICPPPLRKPTDRA